MVTLRTSRVLFFLSKRAENTKRTKHIDLKFHFIKHLISKNEVVDYINTEFQKTDILTKPLCKPRFIKLLNL